jgi:ubiquinone/menaquinone biosynthesis C-methylase UbiE
MERKETIFVSPDTKEPLYYVYDGTPKLFTDGGDSYAYRGDFPDLIFPKVIEGKAKDIQSFYQSTADIYDLYVNQTFKTHNEDETTARNYFIDKLNLKKDSKVLEIACGTGRDSELIAKRIGEGGKFVMADITPGMLQVCKDKLFGVPIDKEFCLLNAAYLPFRDGYFDAVYCFAAVGVFPDIKKSLAEMARVTKVGGKVVISDESMPPWWRDTYFCKVLANTNPKVMWELPLKELPVVAKNVTVQWVIGGLFYLIDFEVAAGEPMGNFDYEVEGYRGGTLRTRLEGKLEGVTKETKDLAYKAAKAKGLTMHQWLDSLVKEAAKKDLNL